MRKVTARQCERISRVAFDWARKRRKKVTAVHKANVLHISDGLFLREVRKVARQYPDVELDEKIVDAMAALLVRDPSRFDCIVTGNMFGDILSDEASEISGSLGLAGSIMAGDDACCAQAQHGSAPDIAGPGQGESDVADPFGGHAARVARRAARAARFRRRPRRRSSRAIDAALQSRRYAHRGSRRQARHAGFRRAGGRAYLTAAGGRPLADQAIHRTRSRAPDRLHGRIPTRWGPCSTLRRWRPLIDRHNSQRP